MTMEPVDLSAVSKIGEKRRKIQEAGIALVFGSLTLLLMVYVGYQIHPSANVTKVVSVEKIKRANPFDSISLKAKAAIVYDLATNKVLYDYHADAQLPLASLTKLLTVYAAQQVLALNSPVTISEEALLAEGDNGFSVGDTFTFQDAAALALVASSNDAAGAIEETAKRRKGAGNEDLLAGAASSAGLTQTFVLNGTGLDETDTISGGYGSAYDIALLTGALLRDAPVIAHASTRQSMSVSDSGGKSYSIDNTNDILWKLPGVLLSKTGFTDLAGGNLVVVFDAGINHPVALVVLGSTQDGRFDDVSRLLETTLASFAFDSL